MKIEVLQQRADLLRRLRYFFADRGFLEVETPLVATETIPEQHIELSQVGDSTGWLQASPEMHHKRLLCLGCGPLFEVTRSFRRGERGACHRPEFTIVEWYRPGDDLAGGVALLDELLGQLLSAPTARRTTYREAFHRVLGVDPHTASEAELRALLDARYGDQAAPSQAVGRDETLNELLALAIEPTLGIDGPELLYQYPASQAALAATAIDERGVEVAERFELYWCGLELANGYHELTDAAELRRRLELANRQRVTRGAEALPMPERLLELMASPGMPPCAGVALGFDRLVMLATGAASIDEVCAFGAEA